MVSPPELSHVGVLRLIDRFDAESLRDWLTLRCFLDAARAGRRPVPDDVVARWLAHSLRDRRGEPLLPGQPTFESRHLLAQLAAALAAQTDAPPSLGCAVAARVRRNFLAPRRKRISHAIAPDTLERVLLALTRDFIARGLATPAGARPVVIPRASLDLNGLGEPRSAMELFDTWHSALHWARHSPGAHPAGPVDIVSKMRRGDLQVLRTSPTDTRARLRVTFPTQPPRTLEIPLRPPFARCLPAFCNPLGPVEHDALRAELRHIPACRAMLEDDDRRARLYWSAAARYAPAPAARRAGHRHSRSWRAALLRGMVLTSSWGGEPTSETPREPAHVRNAPDTRIAASWAACQRWWHAPAFPIAMAHAATPGDDDLRAGDAVDRSDDIPSEVAAAIAPDDPDDPDNPGDPGDPGDPNAFTRTRALLPAVAPMRTRNDDDVTLIWAHMSPGVRRRIVSGARRFARYSPELDGAAGARDDDAIRRLNNGGWYAYSNIPAIFFICEKLLDERQVLDKTAFHALLGDIGRAAADDRAAFVLCFEDQRNQSLAWRVDTTAAPGEEVTPIAAGSTDMDREPDANAATRHAARHERAADATDATDATDAADDAAGTSAHATIPDATRRDAGSRLVLKQILALLAKTNDPPFKLDALLCAMIEVKHEYDADIARHAGRSVAEVRAAIRQAALERLLDINRRGFPRRGTATDAIATTGARRFVDLLLRLLDPVLQAAPDTLAYGGAELFQARFGHYFAERDGKPGVAPGHWAPIASQGREQVRGWCVLTRDESYLAAMNQENPALVTHLKALFATEIARSTWLFNILREGLPPARSAIAKQYLLEAGIPPEHRFELRKFITLNEAQTQHALLREFNNGTFLEIYMAIDDGLEKLREAEPRYMPLLPNDALARLPSRRDVIARFSRTFDDKMKRFCEFGRQGIEAGFAACPASIKADFAAAARLRLHLYRPLATEKSSIAQYLPPLDTDTHHYQRQVFGRSTGAIVETVDLSGRSRFYLFDAEHFTIGNHTTMLSPLPELRDADAAGQYMMRHPDQFFVKRFASIYDEPVYYKNDVRPHLQFECGGLGGVWEKWIAFRSSHQAWWKRVLLERINVEKIQDEPFGLYLGMLPFYTCESVRQAHALTLDVVLDSIFCLVDLSNLRHVLKPMRTWIAHSAAVGRFERQLAWYETLRAESSLGYQAAHTQMEALRALRKSVEEVRRRRSTHEVAVAFRKISHFPFTGSASVGYRLYQATQTMMEIGVRVRSFKNEGRESPMQRFLRWQDRNRLWEMAIPDRHIVQHPTREHKTIVGELRHADELALPHRLREATCSPNVCISACLFDSLAGMTTRRRIRIFVKLLDGTSPQNIVRQSARLGFLLTAGVLRELTQLETDLTPLREKFAAVSRSGFVPSTRRREILNQALLHPYVNTTANARLQASPIYRELADDLYALNFFFESPLQQLVQTLDLPREAKPSCRASAGNETARGMRDQAPAPIPDTAAAP
ncbi:MAG: hypothetical protein ACRYHA_10745, partial [Janthinobacterium lividum]